MFLMCEPSDTFRKLKLRLADVLGAKGGPESVKLFAEDKEKEFVDEAMVSDFGVMDDAVVYVALNGESLS